MALLAHLLLAHNSVGAGLRDPFCKVHHRDIRLALDAVRQQHFHSDTPV